MRAPLFKASLVCSFVSCVGFAPTECHGDHGDCFPGRYTSTGDKVAMVSCDGAREEDLRVLRRGPADCGMLFEGVFFQEKAGYVESRLGPFRAEQKTPGSVSWR